MFRRHHWVMTAAECAHAPSLVQLQLLCGHSVQWRIRRQTTSRASSPLWQQHCTVATAGAEVLQAFLCLRLSCRQVSGPIMMITCFPSTTDCIFQLRIYLGLASRAASGCGTANPLARGAWMLQDATASGCVCLRVSPRMSAPCLQPRIPRFCGYWG